jgi:hypothetical protein
MTPGVVRRIVCPNPGRAPTGGVAYTGVHATVRRRRARPAVLLDRPAPPHVTRRVALALAVWAAWYSAYRFYYAFGGRIGMIGRPSPAQPFRRDNFVGGAIILLAALLPPIAVRAWRHRPVRRLVAVVGWVAAVGCCMHALTLMALRVLSLTGVHPTHVPPGLWLSIDRREADLQDLLFNEPWLHRGLALGPVRPHRAPAVLAAAMATLGRRRVRARGRGRPVERARRHPDVSSGLTRVHQALPAGPR